ncbi:hypothetical protein JCM17846_29340 [Iodidimonas nitroreducens]|uniref:Uncharacterized protein n=1 Tax=Iodidimonas nitroreducens TaxID=1236968 RepID=A0A5A7NAI1_9PROT|nr:hypothetical protein [Iodidimonas nitroreducens]GAK33884.1 hypothetical protein AQ1_01777 [alpha proteobacterium Q-1]GER05252.1 hypothetical protein JCM17846_29340 [Iodidimonas nitroreducens]
MLNPSILGVALAAALSLPILGPMLGMAQTAAAEPAQQNKGHYNHAASVSTGVQLAGHHRDQVGHKRAYGHQKKAYSHQKKAYRHQKKAYRHKKKAYGRHDDRRFHGVSPYQRDRAHDRYDNRRHDNRRHERRTLYHAPRIVIPGFFYR